MKESNKKAVNLFWTGGWDSTYRLLQLLIVLKKRVQPIYLIDPSRLSTGVEIQTMSNIKKELFNQYPQTRNLLLSTIYEDIFDIRDLNKLHDSYKRIKSRKHLGTQYLWIAEYCREKNIKNVELAIEKDGGAYNALKTYISSLGSEDDTNYKVNEDFRDLDEYCLFQYFYFPLFYLTKLEMEAYAKREGFWDLLELTWFCHNPSGNRSPCGVCTPCKLAIKEGMGRRIPLSGKIRYWITIKPHIKEIWKKLKSNQT